MSFLSTSKIYLLTPLACLLVACSADTEPEQKTQDAQGVTESAKAPAPERTGTATSAETWWYYCCTENYGQLLCGYQTSVCVNGPTPTPTFY
jgi:uncharacterized lipoprotein